MFIRKDIMKITFPVFMEQLLIMSISMVNAMLASHIGKEAVSAIGMVDSINNIFIAFFSSVAVGGTVVVAQYTGQHDIEDANEAAKQALFSGTALSIIIAAFILIFRQPIINILYGSAEPEILKEALIYLNITLLTYPLISITLIACGVLRGAGDTKTPMNINVLMNIINIVLSYVLIYGIHINNEHFNINIPGMKVMGAAIGLAAARVIGTFIIVFVLLKGSKIIKVTKLRSFKFSYDLQKSIFGIGIPAGVESLMFNGGKLITQVFIVGMGTAAIAANYISNSIASLVLIPGNALSIVATTLVGQYMGRGESDEAKDVLLYLTKLSSVCLFITCALYFPFTKNLVYLYSRADDIVELSSGILKLYAVVTPILWTLSFLLPAGLKGAGDAKYTMVTSMIGMWVFRITLGYILGIPLKLGVMGIWIGMYVDWLVRGVLYYIRLQKGKWKYNIVISHADDAVAK